jgi:cation:H+ antiporter
MLINLGLFALGLFLVLNGGDFFVDSSTTIASRLKIPRVVVGGTIVSLATTAPELVVSTTASYLGDSGIALGNAIGSAIANIGLIVGISAILAPVAIDVADFRRRAIWMFLSATLVVLFSWNLQVSFQSGLILFLLACSYLVLNAVRAIIERKRDQTVTSTKQEEDTSMFGAVVRFALGAILVIIGSKLLVQSSIAIAEALRIPSLIIGLTAVAVGTSLPELVTAVKAAKKNVADLAIGNIVGANILNLAFITGASAMIRPLSLDHFTRYYAFPWLFIMIIGMMIILWKTGKMNKTAGITLLSLYVVYNVGLMLFTALA